ncbi:MAG: ATP-dependent DNA helicase [Planctomycetota bacterium]
MPLQELTPAQREAATYVGGPLIVLAGPGSGKTFVLIHRIAHAIRERGVEPSRILALTFSNRAARELRERLATFDGIEPGQADAVNARTFHAFGQSILNRFGDRIGLPRSLDLIDVAQEKRICRELVLERDLFRSSIAAGRGAAAETASRRIKSMHHAGLEPDEAAARIDRRLDGIDRREDLSPEDEAERATLEMWRDTVRLWRAREAACLPRGIISFPEQVSLALRLLRQSEAARAITRDECRTVIVDEFQDVDRTQSSLLEQLCPPSSERPPDICVVGDDDQAIYAFRGADDLAFDRFDRVWSAGGANEIKKVELAENFRSEEPILRAARAIIGNAHHRFAPEKAIRRAAAKPPVALPSRVESFGLENFRDDAPRISDAILRDVREALRHEVADAAEGSSAGEPDTLFRGALTGEADEPAREPDFEPYAVIARTHNDLARIRAELDLNEIPIRVARDQGPLDDEGVQDVMAWISLTVDPTSSWDAIRILRRPPYRFDAATLGRWARLYRAGLSRHRLTHDGNAPSNDAMPGFFDWVLRSGVADAAEERQPGEHRTGEDPPAGDASAGGRDAVRLQIEKLARFAASFRTLDAQSNASAVVDSIVRTTGVATVDLLSARARVKRVTALAALVRFARERLDRLEQPRDLAAFRRYMDDLGDAGRMLGSDTSDAREDPPESDDEPANAVTLLTAHASKGLEFDTVFLPRVESQHGYPQSRRADDETDLPAALSDARGDEPAARTESQAHDDEERRLFYVACTRAKRRLVVLGKIPKSEPKGKNANYHWELLYHTGPDAPIFSEAVQPKDMIDTARASDPSAGRGASLPAGSLTAGAKLQERIGTARREARLQAASALDAIDRPGAGSDELAATAARLDDAAKRLAVIAAAEARVTLPEWCEGDEPLQSLYQRLISKAAVDEGDSGGSWTWPLRAPLRLSYSRIDAYRRCACCYFVRYVLGISEPADGRLMLGTAVHAALEKFGARWQTADAEGARLPTADEAAALAAEEFDRSTGLEDETDLIARERAIALVRNAADAFAGPHDVIEGIEQLISVPHMCDGVEHTINAKLDRYDRVETDEGIAYRIIDYKTGQPWPKLLDPPVDDLQLSIYARALASHLGCTLAELRGTAEYRLLQTGDSGVLGLDAVNEALTTVDGVIDTVIRGMLAGLFARAPKCDGACGIFGPAG